MNIRRRFGMISVFTLLLGAAMFLVRAHQGWADEGMWTFDNLPLQQLQQRYGFTPDQAWLDHVRLGQCAI